MSAPLPYCQRCHALGSRCGICSDATYAEEPKPAQPSVEPELRLTEDEQDWFLRNGYGMRAGPAQLRHLIDQLKLIAPLLSRAGLSIVPASDVPSPEERKVLEVLGDVPNTLIDDWRRWPSGWLMLLAKAELARRAAKETDHAERSRRETGDW